MIRKTAALTLLFLLGACSESVSPRAERVYYRGGGSASWGTVCALNPRGFLGLGKRGYVSVAHVTENGTPLIGPKDAVTVSDTLADWSFLGIDPMQLDAQDYPAMRAGMAVEIHGFPARDRDGEVVPGIAYLDDPMPPFWWIELHDSDEGVAAEGVIGGFSGSCVLDANGALVAVVHANGFSHIGGTTNTFAKVVPVREAILQAQGRAIAPVAQDTSATPIAPLPAYPDRAPVPAPAPIPAPVPVPAPIPDPVAPPAYVEVAPPYLDDGPVPVTTAPARTQDRAALLPDATEASARVAPPVHRPIIPAPRRAYRPRGIDCGQCI